MNARAVFFDRDDTLMRNVPYLGDPAQVVVYPGAAQALSKLKNAGFLLFIVSNQSGVGRGFITKEQVEAVSQEMHRQLGDSFFTETYNCYFAPEDPYCEGRKPDPHFVLKAASEYQLDLSRSFFVGDRSSDILCGRNAGCRSVLVLTGPADADQEKSKGLADFVAADLVAAADWICSQ